MLKILKLIISAGVILAIFGVQARAVTISYELCENYPNNGTIGRCMHLADCPYLLDLLMNVQNETKNVDILRNSSCGFDETQNEAIRRPLVCCPDPPTNDKNLESSSFPELGNILPKPGACGVDLDMRIFGGSETHVSEFSWLALVEYKTSFNDSHFPCAGALINSRYILTAAHCIKNVNIPSTWRLHGVRLGEWKRNSEQNCTMEDQLCPSIVMEKMVSHLIVHKNYDPSSLNQFNDIALLRMVENVQYNEFVRPICLPLNTELRGLNYTGTKMEVAGWGKTETSDSSLIKLKATVGVWNTSECNEKYASIKISINVDSQICAGGMPQVDTCRGDSGGPLMVSQSVNRRRAYYIAGIVSHGLSNCGVEGWPGIYTRVDHFIDWIVSNLEP